MKKNEIKYFCSGVEYLHKNSTMVELEAWIEEYKKNKINYDRDA